MKKPTREFLLGENEGLRNKIQAQSIAYNEAAIDLKRTERELIWVKQQFEFLLRALQPTAKLREF